MRALFSCCRSKRSREDAVSIECHFCGTRQSVEDANKFFCSACQQYNGFKEDGDYNIVRPELFIEELNPTPISKGEFRVASSVVLCEQCDRKNSQWLAQDRELIWSLCPECAFLVKEAVAKSVVRAKTQYLAASVSRGPMAAQKGPELGLVAQTLLVAVMLACLAVLSLGVLSQIAPRFWFFASELVFALVAVLYLGVNGILHAADPTSWNVWWMSIACVVHVTLFLISIPKSILVSLLSGAWLGVLSLLGLRVLAFWKQARHRRVEAEELKKMARPVVARTDHQDGDADDELPWRIGVNGKGWSSRKATFEFKPGDRGPGAPIAGQRGVPPSAEELAVESLLSGFSIMGDDERPATNPVAVATARAARVWGDAPRMTLGSIAAAFACRVVFFDKEWSAGVAAAFLLTSAIALHLETNIERRMQVSIGLGLVSISQVLPWRLIAALAWNHFEVLVILGVFIFLVLVRNKKV